MIIFHNLETQIANVYTHMIGLDAKCQLLNITNITKYKHI